MKLYGKNCGCLFLQLARMLFSERYSNVLFAYHTVKGRVSLMKGYSESFWLRSVS